MANSFDAKTELRVGDRQYQIYSLNALGARFDIDHLPFCLKILLENLLRNENGLDTTAADIEALASWDASAKPSTEIAFTPARVLLQDFTGVPAVVDLAAMRDAMRALGEDPAKINPLSPVELVIDHSVQVDVSASPDAQRRNVELEYERNGERYAFLRWGQQAFDNFKVVPPGTGIVHQVNLEYLARVVFDRNSGAAREAYPDSVVGTDSHTTMINGLGVLGWGVGGIEAEAAMLGQPVSMLIPEVVGFKLRGKLPEGTTATDLVLTVVEMLRAHGVVGKFVEFFGEGLDHLPLADRATVANMAPEYGATCGIFPIDDESLRYMRMSGRDDAQVELVEAYAKAQGLFRDATRGDAVYSDVLELDIGSVVPSIAGPKRPQDRIPLSDAKRVVADVLARSVDNAEASIPVKTAQTPESQAGSEPSVELSHADVVIAAITSCTNTSNPSVMMAAGLLAKKAVARGLTVKPWVKTSLAPGSLVVKDYLERAGLMDDLRSLGFHIVGFGCTTCIGNSGPLAAPISAAIRDGDLSVSAVLSGNRNFEGRVHAEVKLNFLASPPLVVAYALAGTTHTDLRNDPLGRDAQGEDVYLRDIWPTSEEVHETVRNSMNAQMFTDNYASVFEGDEQWKSMPVPAAERYEWDITSTYVRNPPYFEDMSLTPRGIPEIRGARMLALLADSITTDHISPAGAIIESSPAGQYLVERQVLPQQFNSYGSRRGNHEVMMRGTFANVRLRNLLAPGTEGGWTVHQPSGEQMSIFDAAMRYQEEEVPLMVIAGSEYGTGSSRDWAAKGTLLLGVKAVLVKSFERIHRSNLVGMGVLPLQFSDGQDKDSLGLSAQMTFDIEGLAKNVQSVTVVASSEDAPPIRFEARVRIDTPKEWDYYEHGGILHYVIRQLAAT